MRPDGRQPDQLRPYSLERGVAKFAEGSCLIKMGDTHVLCVATVEDRVPGWLKAENKKNNSNRGWVTAEYSMLPRSGRDRNQREIMKPSGRSLEIQRLIGRCIRSVVELDRMGEYSLTVDCDVLQADGGTRTASVTGAYVAVYDAMNWMVSKRMLPHVMLREPVAAISVGVFRNAEILDLNYDEDSNAATDMNVVMTGSGKFVEVQGTAEQEPFSAETLGKMLKLGKKGIDELIQAQKDVLGL